MATGAHAGARARRRAFLAIAMVVGLAVVAWWFEPVWLYGWIKVLHIVAAISWMAGLLYLPRLFVYHADAEPGCEPADTLMIMEARLFKVIMTPAMVVTWFAGLWLAWSGFGYTGFWLWIKIASIVGLTVFHSFLGRSAGRFAVGKNNISARQWRMMNEIPTVLMIVAIIMVIIKPFS